jgi:hypothetical protein
MADSQELYNRAVHFKGNPSNAGRQNRPGNRKEHFAKMYATKMYLNDAIGRWNHFKTEAGIKSDEGSRILCWSSLYTKHHDGFNCGKHITHIPGYFSYVNVVIFPHYKTLLRTYSAVESQTDQPYKDSPKAVYEYILQLIMKVCITFYAFLNPGEKKSNFWFSLWNSIFFISHFQTNILIIL